MNEDPTPPEKEFLAKFRKRPLFTITAGYIGVALSLLYAASFAVQTFNLSHRILQWLVVLAVSGLPLVMFRAWKIDRRTRGLPSVPQAPRSWLLLALLTALPATAVLVFDRLQHPTPPVQDRSVAVLPFKNVSGDDQNKFIADGMQGEVLANLSKIATLKVINRSPDAAGHDVQASEMRETSRALGAAYAVEGTTSPSR